MTATDRTNLPPGAVSPLVQGYRTMLGLDGTSIDDAVEQAYTPTGPSRDVIRARLEFRRAHPDRLHPPGETGVAGRGAH
ncbi:hypothetical protein CFK38_11500 [Brachybacterium vulturis]|uniref:Uncharacterized protein n=1 Tax=Brachybacterium vulturis TaxID=2017484 RepID=A0A291GQ10_9MICO|nr:hypothetical protein [Brachybacterium vulturis]ATG52076.1 hypothetical protein CFK38_11500 [Brachybacterium vulturis]